MAAMILGEWACLGILYGGPSHGFAVAAELKPEAEIGRIWSLSRALTYRALDQLTSAGLIEPIGEERGIAGGNRTILRNTRRGRAQFREWCQTPVEHLRDVRSELLLKIVLGRRNGIDTAAMLDQQAKIVDAFLDRHRAQAHGDDVVELWRYEAASAIARFLARLS